MDHHPLKPVWRAMRGRCHNPRNKQYPDYGLRGITVCHEWYVSFDAFLKDMGEPPFKGASLDRIDNSKGYSPENCRWATRIEQNRNKRNNRLWSFNGVEKLLIDHARDAGIRYQTVVSRVYLYGWTLEDALTKPKFYRPKKVAA